LSINDFKLDILILNLKLIINISFNIIYKLWYLIKVNFWIIFYLPFLISFNPDIYYSFNNNINLKNVIPSENISDNSGLNSLFPYPFEININSGDI